MLTYRLSHLHANTQDTVCGLVQSIWGYTLQVQDTYYMVYIHGVGVRMLCICCGGYVLWVLCGLVEGACGCVGTYIICVAHHTYYLHAHLHHLTWYAQGILCMLCGLVYCYLRVGVCYGCTHVLTNIPVCTHTSEGWCYARVRIRHQALTLHTTLKVRSMVTHIAPQSKEHGCTHSSSK